MHPIGNSRQKRKGQHYIPRFYLKQFSIERNGEHYVWCYNKKTGDVFESNINNICKENWFYDRHNIFEDALSIIDGYHSTIYRFIEEIPMYALMEPEKRKIMEFVYLTHARTRRARELTMEQLMNFNYYILKNNTEKIFYTSDHPISQFDKSNEKGIKVAMPLAPDLFLIMNNSEDWMQLYPSQKIQASKWFVNEANKAMIQVAKDFIFSKTNDFEFVRQFLSNQDE